MKKAILVFSMFVLPSMGYAMGSCSGVPESCQSFTSYGEDLCYQQYGCRWSQEANACEGFADSCGALFDISSCERQRGCFWSPVLIVPGDLACR